MSMVANSTADQNEGYLASKIVAGSNITLTTVNPGADEKLQIAASGGASPARQDISALCTLGANFYNVTTFKVYRRYIGDGKRVVYDFLIQADFLTGTADFTMADTAAGPATSIGSWIAPCWLYSSVAQATPAIATIGTLLGGLSTTVTFFRDGTLTQLANANTALIGTISFDID